MIKNNYILFQVDAHNIVPCWESSPKQEYGARTIRNKIHNQLSGYLTEFPPVCVHPYTAQSKSKVSIKKKLNVLEVYLSEIFSYPYKKKSTYFFSLPSTS
jgi:hypothetical protein